MKKHLLVIISLLFIKMVVLGQVNATDFVEISAGSFSMGNAAYAREAPLKSINISSFYMSKKVITNAQFAAFLNAYESAVVKTGEFAGETMFVTDSWGVVNNNGVWDAAANYENYPMIKVTWFGANEFCKFYGGRLPTEAEWEYAAKGGKTQIAYTYSGSSSASVVAWYYDNSGHLNKAVGTKSANTAGLFDMSGNVYQWCADWYGRYSDFGVNGDLNPLGPDAGVSKVIRGGYRSLGSTDLHLSHRESVAPNESYNFVGFRMVKSDLSAGNTNIDLETMAFPNPAGGILNIKDPALISRTEIVDCQGRLIYESDDQNSTISISNWSNGTYFVKLITATKIKIQKIVIKN